MTTSVAGVPNSRKTPGFYMAVVLGGPGTSAGAAPMTICLIGNMIEADIADSGDYTYTISAGTEQASSLATETYQQIYSPDEAGTKYGLGSELHLAAKAVFDQYPDAALYCCPCRENSGNTAASATLTFVSAATGGGTLRLIINGEALEIGVSSGDSISDIAQDVCAAVLDATARLPVVADCTAGVVTFTAKHGGPRGNNIQVKAYWVSSSTTRQIGSSATASGFGTTGALSSAKLASGATADSIANALSAISNTRFDRIAIAHDDSTNINRLRDHLDSLAAATIMLWGQGIAATTVSPNSALTLSAAINASRIQLAHLESAEQTTAEIAAQVAAARVSGDSTVGGILVGEASDPAVNLDGCMLKTIKSQLTVSDIPLGTEVENMLNYGITPLVPSPNHPGYTQISRSVTTRHKSGASLNYAVLDTTNVGVTDYMADVIRQDLAITFAGYKAGSDSEDGAPGKIPNVVTPLGVRARVLFKLKEAEAAGIIRDVDKRLAELVVEENPLVPGRFDMDIPVEPMPGLHIGAGNVRQRN